MENGRRETLRRKYLSLGLGEMVAASAFAGIALFVLMRRMTESDTAALWAALAPLLLVLLQAGVYWLFARAWVGRGHGPALFVSVYRVFRVVDPLVLAAGLVGVVRWWPNDVPTALLVMAVWLFGVTEYVNYFVVRLSYPATRWFRSVGQWRTPRLVQDMNRSASGFQPSDDLSTGE